MAKKSKMMSSKDHVVFFGFFKSFDYFKVGGLESFYRRIASSLFNSGFKVSFVFYGSPSRKTLQVSNGITVEYFEDFEKTLDYLTTSKGLVFANYLLKRDRLKYFFYRYQNRNIMRFGHIYSGEPLGLFKKALCYLGHRLTPYNGPVLSLSRTIEKSLSAIRVSSNFFLPPVPSDYRLCQKNSQPRPLNITFLGRFDENKGINEVTTIFTELSSSPREFALRAYGYFGHGQRDERQLRNTITSIPSLEFEIQEWKKWSPEADKSVREILQNTDILILPYKNLKGTMDPPYLVLEGMASLCAIITTDVGSIREFYGASKFIVKDKNFVTNATTLLRKISTDIAILHSEQARILSRNKILAASSINMIGNCESFILM